MNICKAEGCRKQVQALCLCNRHYKRMRDIGSVELPPKLTLEERIRRNVKVLKNGCWQWQNSLIRGGYGQMSFGCRTRTAHQWSYICFKGKIPKGLVLDHLCRNPGCVNPNHLEAVTTRENTIRGENFIAVNVKKTHCRFGHPFDSENTFLKYGWRICRICARRHGREHKRRIRALAKLGEVKL